MQHHPGPLPSPEAPIPQPPQGTTIHLGRLTVGKQLGMGGFGVVYAATLEGINHDFAIKILQPSMGNDDLQGASKRFLREAQVLFRLRHTHIVPIYGVGEHEGRPYILMEYFKGCNLHAARRFGPQPEVILPFIEKIAGALGYAHENNVVHRDIKPQNLMTAKGDARILDFGVAALLDPGGERFTKSSDAVAGDSFSAPELTEKPMLVDPRCDIYSLGACWYWLLTGMAPKGLNWESKLRASVRIPQEYERVILRCLDQADRRYASARELADDVRALRNGQAPSQSTHDLTDDQARLLGVIIAKCVSSTDSVAWYAIEQEIGGHQSRFRTSLALRGLLQGSFISEVVEREHDGPYSVYKPLDKGLSWAERNLARIEDLLQPIEQVRLVAPSSDSDDIPF